MKAHDPAPTPRADGAAVHDRRAGPDAATWRRTMRRLRGFLQRPLRIERRGLQLHLLVVERRRAAATGSPLPPAEVRAALRARLGTLGREFADERMRHLLVVHRELGSDDWDRVSALPAVVLRKALMEAELLTSGGSSPALEFLVERLRRLKADGQERELARRQRAHVAGTDVEVSETTPLDFEQTSRGWFDTQPDALVAAVTPPAPPAAP